MSACIQELERRVLLTSPNLHITSAYLVDGQFTQITAPVIGEMVGIRVNYTTTDLPSNAQYEIRYSMDGIDLGPGVITNGAGFSSSSWFRTYTGWYAAPGNHNVVVTLDPTNTVSETNESDNSVSFSFAPVHQTTLPNLIQWPFHGQPIVEAMINNYADVDPRDGIAADYLGGPYQYDGHDAFDISIANFAAMDAGISVFAAASGTVVEVQDGNYDRETESLSVPANYVKIDHGNGWSTLYYHLSTNTITVKVGDTVTTNTIIGQVGSSGHSSGAHLHFNLYRYNRPIETGYARADYWAVPFGYAQDDPTEVINSGITNYSVFTADDIQEEPSEVNTFSTTGNDTVYFWYKISPIEPPDTVRIKWYRPNGTLYTTYSGDPTVARRVSYHNWSFNSTAWKTAVGTWRVALEINGVEKASETFTVTSAAAPAEIRIRQAGVLVNDGRTTPIDFGTVAQNGTAGDQSFVIENHGGSTLNLSLLQLPEGFSVVGSFPATVAAGGNATLTLRMATNEIASRFGEIRLGTNDASEAIYTFNLSGTVTGTLPSGNPTLTLVSPTPLMRFGNTVVVDGMITISDPNAATYNAAQLTATFVSGALPNDVLGIRNQGTAANQVGVSGSNVSYGGTVIGTFTGGSAGAPLVITFNASATAAGVQAVAQNITYTDGIDNTISSRRYVGFKFRDVEGLTSLQRVKTIIFDKRNDAPSVSLTNRVTSLSEAASTATRTRVADIVITDDGAGTNTLSLGGADASLFEFVGSSLYLKAGIALDFETNPVLDVTVSVNDATVGATPDSTVALSINLTDVNEPPTLVLQSTINSLSEAASTSSPIRIANIVVTDDALGSETLGLTGADAGMFEIVGSQLFLKQGMVLDFETNPVLDVTVTVDDTSIAGSPDASRAHSVQIVNVNEPATVQLTNPVTSLSEGASTASRIKVADIVVTGDALGTDVVSLTGTNADLFEIVGAGLFLRAGTGLDFETVPTLSVTVAVDDATIGSTPDATANLSISITNVNEAPSVSLVNTVTSFSESFNTSTRTRVADIQITDDGTGTNAVDLTGVDAALFEIVGTSLFLRAGVVLDFESNPALDVTVTVDDTAIGATPDASTSLQIAITDVVESAPVIGSFSGAVTFMEDGAAIALDSDATFADSDSPNLPGGSVTLTLVENAEASDRLAIRHQGTAAGQIGVSGSNVSFGSTIIGTFAGGQGTTPLVITLNAAATPAAVQALIQNLTFANVSDTPSTLVRRVRIDARDEDGQASAPAFKTISVTPKNDASTVAAFSGTTPFVENGGAVLVDEDATVTDPDSANFDTGKLTISLTANGHADDRLTIRNEGTATGQVGVSGLNVTFGGVLVGTLAGGTGTTPLVVTFKAAATAAIVQAVLRNVLFSNVSANPTSATHTVQVTLTDGDGGTSLPVTKSITVQGVNTPPSVVIGANITYFRGAAATLIAAAGTATDPDSTNFNGGNLTIQVTANAESTDQLRIVNQGTAAGKIGTAGNTITFGGVNNVIGTFTGSDGGTPLVITFTSDLATSAAVQALLRDITFGSSSATPSPLQRTVRVVLDDGDGAASPPVTKTIDVSHNTTIGGWDGTTAWTEGMAPVVIDTGVTITDPDTTSFDGYVLRATLAANGTADDRLSVRNQGGGSNQIGFDGTNVRFQGVVIGTAAGGDGLNPLALTLNAAATTAALQNLIQNLTFSNVSDAPAAPVRTVRLVLVDAAGYLNAAVSKTVTLTPTNDAPTMGSFDGTTPFVEAAGPVTLDGDWSVADPDSPNFDTGKLTIKISANGHADDRLTLRNEGTASGQVGVNGLNVTYGGLLIGTFSGGSGTTPLVITFKATADAAAVQAVARCVLFSNVSTTPTTAARTLQATLTDGDGGTSLVASKTVTVQAVNTAPTVAIGPAINSPRGGAATLVAATGTVTDPDSTNFNGGRLTIQLSANSEATDQLRIVNQGTVAGKIGVAGSNVTFGGVLIGTFTGGDGATPLVITFTTDAANAASVQALLRAITFANTATSPLVRTLQVTLDDGDGATSAPVTKSIVVIHNTVIGGWDGTMAYTEGAAPVLIDSAVTVTDSDTSSFAGFVLNVALDSTATADDRLSIRNQGVGTIQIGFDGTTVRFQGTAIGTASGGTGLNPLVLTFNAAATSMALQSLIQNLTFANVSDAPATPARVARLVLSDASGYANAAVSKSLTVTAVNDAPVIGAFGGDVQYASSGNAVLVDDDATVADPDQLDFATGKLTLQLTNNAQSTDRLRIRNQGTGAGQIGVEGSTVTYGGMAIGAFTGGSGTTALVITLNANADAAAVQALLRNIEFTSTSFAPSLLPRTIKASLTDGDGGTSNLPTKTISLV